MQRAIELAQQGYRAVAPNPLVGAVVVKEGAVVAEGAHLHYGEEHAEAQALKVAGSRAGGATLYCNLEPCSFDSPKKHQPPCVQAILRAGIKKVVIANIDPYPEVAGEGVRQLKKAGLEVKVGVLAEEAAQLNQGFFHRLAYQRPFVRLKVAQSLDGSLACKNGHSRWISNLQARGIAHSLRSESDAILVARATACIDDPLLNIRHCPFQGRQPLRIVLDTQLRLPLSLKLFQTEEQATLLVTSERHQQKHLAVYRQQGVSVLQVEEDEQARLNIEQLLRRLALDYHCNNLLVEGGSLLFTQLLQQRLFDQMIIFIAPLFLAGQPTFADFGVEQVNAAPRLRFLHYQLLSNEQLLVNGWRQGGLVPDSAQSHPWSVVNKKTAAAGSLLPQLDQESC